MLLKPYFHGTTSRIGAPFWFISVLPYRPTARIVSGCIASSIRSPSMYGHSSDRDPLSGHFRGAAQRGERDIGGLALRLGALEHGAERNAHPRDHHRPRFDAPQPVDALLQLDRLDQVLELIGRRLAAQAVDLHRPRRRLHAAGVPRRIVLAGAELVEVVVAGDVLEAVQLLVGRHHARLDVGERRLAAAPSRAGAGGKPGGRWRVAAGPGQGADRAGDGRGSREAHELTAAHVDLLVGNLAGTNVARSSNQHASPRGVHPLWHGRRNTVHGCACMAKPPEDPDLFPW